MRLKTVVQLVFVLILGTCFLGGAFAAGGQEAKSKDVTEEKVKITVWGPRESYSQAEKDSWTFCVEEYRKRYPNVEIESMFTPEGMGVRQLYDKAVMAGNAPTVTNCIPFVDVPSRAKDGTIADITSMVENWDLIKEKGKINTTMDPALHIDGKWYGLMDYVYLAATPYNKTALKAGMGSSDITLPTTWDEFVSIGEQVTDPSIPRFGYLLLGMDWNAWPFTLWVWSAGGEMVEPNADGTYRIAYTDEPGVDVAELWNKMIWEYKMTQKDVLKGWSDFKDDMQAGRGVFGFGRMDYYTTVSEEKYGIPPETYGIFPVPGKDKNTPPVSLAGGNAWVFSATATEEELQAAWDFVMLSSYDEEFLYKKWEYQDSIGGLTDRVPARADLIDKKYAFGKSWAEGWAEQFAIVAKSAKLEYYCADWNNLKNIIAPYLQEILLNEGITRNEIKELLKKAAEETYNTYPESFSK